MTKLILASTSPYREKLLKRIVPEFRILKPNVDEDDFKAHISEPQMLAESLAEEKALSVFNKHEKSIVIGGDQVASIDGEILGKPGDITRGVEQLLKLQGKTHRLFTSVCIMGPDRKELYTNETILTMKALDEEQIRTYLKLDKPFDCAGSYKIEKHGIALFEKVESDDFTAITGLPLIKLSLILEEFGFVSFSN